MGNKAKTEQEQPVQPANMPGKGVGLGVLGNGTAAYETVSVSPNEIISPLSGLKDLLMPFGENMVKLVVP